LEEEGREEVVAAADGADVVRERGGTAAVGMGGLGWEAVAVHHTAWGAHLVVTEEKSVGWVVFGQRGFVYPLFGCPRPLLGCGVHSAAAAAVDSAGMLLVGCHLLCPLALLLLLLLVQ